MGDDSSDARRLPRASWDAPCDKQNGKVSYTTAFIAWGGMIIMLWLMVKLAGDE